MENQSKPMQHVNLSELFTETIMNINSIFERLSVLQNNLVFYNEQLNRLATENKKLKQIEENSLKQARQEK